MRTTLNTLGWALFLAVSWTWCIGMFLPSLMVRDGGVAYFLAFLIPNVLGAASVGWVLARPERSRAFVARLRPILIVFTAVTVAFHGFFLAWRGGMSLWDGVPYELIGILSGAAVVLLTAGVRRRVDWVPALVTLLFSFACGTLLVAFPPATPINDLGPGLIGLAMVTTLGFGLCPYLDLTFNRACQHAASPRGAFTVGFLVIFLLTILIVTRGRVIWTPRPGPVWNVGVWLDVAMGCHFGAQAAFTIAAHAAAARRTAVSGAVGDPVEDRPALPGQRLLPVALLPFVIGAALGAIVFYLPPAVAVGGESPMETHELGYRFFLAAYGLVFPAWMLLCARGRSPLTRSTLVWLVVTCLVAIPFYWIGMISLNEHWLIPGAGVVIAAAALRRMTGPRALPRAEEP